MHRGKTMCLGKYELKYQIIDHIRKHAIAHDDHYYTQSCVLQSPVMFATVVSALATAFSQLIEVSSHALLSIILWNTH